LIPIPKPPAPPEVVVVIPDWVESGAQLLGTVLGWILAVAILAVPAILFGAWAIWFLLKLGSVGLAFMFAYYFLVQDIRKEIRNEISRQ